MSFPALEFWSQYGKEGILIWGFTHLAISVFIILVGGVFMNEAHISGWKFLVFSFIVGLFSLAGSSLFHLAIKAYLNAT